MSRSADRQTGGYADRQIRGWANGQIQMNRWEDGQIKGQTDRQTARRSHVDA